MTCATHAKTRRVDRQPSSWRKEASQPLPVSQPVHSQPIPVSAIPLKKVTEVRNKILKNNEQCATVWGRRGDGRGGGGGRNIDNRPALPLRPPCVTGLLYSSVFCPEISARTVVLLHLTIPLLQFWYFRIIPHWRNHGSTLIHGSV